MVNDRKIDEVLERLVGKIVFPTAPEGLYGPLRQTVSNAGKLVRPRLCLTTYSLFRDRFDDGIICPAAAVEMFHNFTLIHDDIMDGAALRRGAPTLCRKWGENTAILAGDVLCIDSYRMMMKTPAKVLPRVLDLFAKTGVQVCEGQQLDMDYEGLQSITMEQYMELIGLKTAVLLACAAEIGAMLAGADAKVCGLLYEYGYQLGLAFQIADDWLDVFGAEVEFGKAVGGDIVNNKKTWLLTRAFEKVEAGASVSAEGSQNISKQTLLEAMAMPVATEEEKARKFARVKELYVALGVDTDAREEIVRLHAEAMKRAEKADLGKIRLEVLRRYAERLVGRTK